MEFPLAVGQRVQVLRPQDWVGMVVGEKVNDPPERRLNKRVYKKAPEHPRHESGVLAYVTVETQSTCGRVVEEL